MLGAFATASHLTPIHQMSLAVLSRAACASMSTTTTTATTTTRDRGDRYGPMEWAIHLCKLLLLYVLSINDLVIPTDEAEERQQSYRRHVEPFSKCAGVALKSWRANRRYLTN